MELDQGSTPKGQLPPFEVAKAFAFEAVLDQMEKHMKKSCWELLGTSKKEFTAQKLQVVGGGNPTARAVQKHWTKGKHDGKWFPGKKSSNQGKGPGRPPSIPQEQKQAIANKAMELKKDIIAPTPQRIRSILPRKTINKATDEPICNKTIREIFKTMCYDEKEDDPWQYLVATQQDYLTDGMKKARVKTADHVIQNVTENAAWNFVAIDPCFTMLPRKQDKADLLKVAAMGHRRWMSQKSKKKGVNLRAPATAKTQKQDCDIVPWTPVFTRGRLKIVVLTEPKAKLSNSKAMADFVKDTLPEVLEGMKRKWKWTSIPRVILHDKASYFVNVQQNILNATFAEGLQRGRFKSWAEDDTKWLAGLLGDLYPHETVVSHVRRLLSKKFLTNSLWETPSQFQARMKKVEDYLNNEMGEGKSLENLGQELHTRAEKLKQLKGERLPK